MPLETLRNLEVSLHRPEVRSDPAKLKQLLHPDFREFGRSGAHYTYEEIVAELTQETTQPVFWSQDFELELVANDVVLLIYRSAHIGADGELERHTHRSSLWQNTRDGWKLRFHQGTPTSAFQKHAT